jgi:hypothetical protein
VPRTARADRTVLQRTRAHVDRSCGFARGSRAAAPGLARSSRDGSRACAASRVRRGTALACARRRALPRSSRDGSRACGRGQPRSSRDGSRVCPATRAAAFVAARLPRVRARPAAFVAGRLSRVRAQPAAFVAGRLSRVRGDPVTGWQRPARAIMDAPSGLRRQRVRRAAAQPREAAHVGHPAFRQMRQRSRRTPWRDRRHRSRVVGTGEPGTCFTARPSAGGRGGDPATPPRLGTIAAHACRRSYRLLATVRAARTPRVPVCSHRRVLDRWRPRARSVTCSGGPPTPPRRGTAPRMRVDAVTAWQRRFAHGERRPSQPVRIAVC